MQQGFHAKYWNLAMTAAWAKFRNREMVDKFDGPTPEDWKAYNMYPSMWKGKPQEKTLSLHNALITGKLKASGHHNASNSQMAPIEPIEWETLIIAPPKVYRCLPHNIKDEPWLNIRIVGADVQKLWRSKIETSGRSKYDWPTVKRIYKELLTSNPDISQNEIIEEIQLEFQNQFSKEPPSRTTIQNKIKIWQ